jgi:hypothetical protein
MFPAEAQTMSRANVIPREAIWALLSWSAVLLLMAALGEIYLRNSTPAAVALTFSEHNAAIQSAVGGDVHAQLNWIGSIHYEGDQSWASFSLQIEGARRHGSMDVTLQRQHDKWTVTTGRLVTDSGSVVQVSEATTRAPELCAAN